MTNKKNIPFELVVIGASGGIGQHLCKVFGRDHKVIGTYCRNKPINPAPGTEYFELDVTDSTAVNSFVEQQSAVLRRPVLVYAPGLSSNAVTHKIRDEDWHDTIKINLSGAMYCCRAFLPRMRELGWGRVILMSSVLARTGVPGTLAYSVTKAGLCSMARVISAEYASKGITVNALALGYFSVGVIRDVPDQYLKDRVIPSIPKGELGNPDDIANAVSFLAASDYTTGATLDINGGIIAS